MDLMTILLPLLGALAPFLLTLFPGLNQILTIIPRSIVEILVKLKGGTVTWAPPVAVQRENLRVRKAVLEARAYAGQATTEDIQNYNAIQAEEAQLKGTLMDFIMSLIGGGGGGSIMPILLIVGLVVALPMITGGGGCGGSGGCSKKPTPATPAPKVSVKVPVNPQLGLTLAQNQ